MMTRNNTPPPAATRSGPRPPVQSVETPATPATFDIVTGPIASPQRVLVYGPGGIGKSTIAALAPAPVFLDIEGGTNELDIARVGGLSSLDAVRQCLRSPVLDPYQTVVIDSATKLEELVTAHVLATVPHEKQGARITSLESYGFGKGYSHLYDAFLLVLADCDALVRKGKHVILIAHECVADRPNPSGDDFIRFEPRLQSPKSGKSSIRNRVVEWSDHVLFIGYDVIAEDGKGRGAGTRTIYTSEMPDHIAKSRRTAVALPFTDATDGAIWDHLLSNGGN